MLLNYVGYLKIEYVSINVNNADKRSSGLNVQLTITSDKNLLGNDKQ